MAQATRPLPQASYTVENDVFLKTIGATAIPSGTLCMNDGAGAAIPFLDSTYETPTGCLAGVAQGDYAAAATDARGFLFKQGCRFLAPAAKTGDVPTVANLGGPISMQDNQTVKATIAAGGLVVQLLDIRSDGYLVQLPIGSQRGHATGTLG